MEKYGTARQITDDKATGTQSEYVILIAFPRQQWLSERASMLRLHVPCLSCLLINMCCVCITYFFAFRMEYVFHLYVMFFALLY